MISYYVIIISCISIPIIHAEPSNPYSFNGIVLSDMIYQKIDNFRTKYVESIPLQRDHILDDISKNHSIDMSINNYISHTNKQGLTPADRVKSHNYTCQIQEVASKIAPFHNFDVHTMTYDWLTHEELAHKILKKFFSSPKGHAEVILDNSTTQMGIGIVQSHNQMIITTVMFC